MFNLLFITPAQHLEVPKLSVLLWTFYSAPLPPAFHKWLCDFFLHLLWWHFSWLFPYYSSCPTILRALHLQTLRVVLESNCNLNRNHLLTSHPIASDTDGKTQHYAHTKPHKLPAYRSCPSAEHTSISIRSRKKTQNHRKSEHNLKKTV